ncbi:demethylmenaquinone methyltransferase / 2-methoxy-6-polyprenyl-1,4-benzoquinol methylase [Fodinibius salinus]|uniref:Demethylmenaquinone methyltransferase / 2-methoxy-6-polyprenyl-1,4-benzoquinol methylase n=1 Tax=Fodinibius salinus TaxID=860790 RepID=A0A5D3YLX5_9BACT|nr:methyltransferase domain-containing protein [Fodinibius salinus]TYP94954.1 demethylmenaquinone methyltransferase / 2-methoxy-6-polyprenyl-1,4-benzoquinol methylase [Fodinibius salinus]
MEKQIFSLDEIQEIYGNSLATNYDLSLLLLRMLGLRVKTYREKAIQSLKLKSGDTIVDLGCGTGLNFPLLSKQIGRKGTIIGVDLSESMLQQAENRIQNLGLDNVKLVQADMSEYNIPSDSDGVLSTLAISMSPDYDRIIKRAAHRLQAGKRMAIFELKRPKKWPEWLVKAMINLLQSYGVRYEHTKQTPWVSMQKDFQKFYMQEFYFGAVYVAAGVV